VSPVIERNFPAREVAAYERGLQARNQLLLPSWFIVLHQVSALLGGVATLAALILGLHRRDLAGGLCAAVLLCLVGNAALTGTLSGPHARYQSRVIWLVTFAPMVALPALTKRRLSLSPSSGPLAPSAGGEAALSV
jgi:hypothetical protein